MYVLTLKELIKHTKMVASINNAAQTYKLIRMGAFVVFSNPEGSYTASVEQTVLVHDDFDVVQIAGEGGESLRFNFQIFGGSRSKSELLDAFTLRNKKAHVFQNIVHLFEDFKTVTSEITNEEVRNFSVLTRRGSSPTLALTLHNRSTKQERVVQFILRLSLYPFYPICREVPMVSDTDEHFRFHFSGPNGTLGKVISQKTISIPGQGFDGSAIGDFHPTPFQEMLHDDLVRKLVDPNEVFYVYGPGKAKTATMVQIEMIDQQSFKVSKINVESKEIKSIPFTEQSQAIWFYIKSLFEMAG